MDNIKDTIRALVILPTFFCLSFIVSAQDLSVIDSLEREVKQEDDPIEKIKILNQIAGKYSNTDSAKTVYYANQAIELSEKINHYPGKLDALYFIAWINVRKRYNDDAKRIFESIIYQADSVGYREGKINALNGLCTVYIEIGEYDQASIYADEADALNQLIDHDKGKAYTFYNMAVLALQAGDIDKAKEFIALAKSLKIPLDDYIELTITNKMGIIYATQGQLKRALDEFFKALEIEQRKKNLKGISGSYNNIGVLFYQLKDYEKAKQYYKEAYKVYETIKDDFGIATYYSNIGLIYLDTHQPDSAIYYFKKGIEIGEKVDFKRLLGWVYDGMSKVTQQIGDLDDGLYWAEKSLNIRRPMGQNMALSQTFNTLGKNLQLMGRNRRALIYFDSAEHISRNIGNPLNLRDALLGKSIAYQRLGKYKDAYHFQVEYQLVNDSLVNEQNLNTISRLEAEFAFQQEKDRLQFEQEMKDMSYEIELKQKSRTQTNTYIGLSTIFILLVFSLVLFYKSVQSNKMIVANRDELEKLNKAKTRFFSIISHDLRNPVNQLTGYSDLIWRGVSPHIKEEDLADLNQMYNNQQRSAKRIVELLDGLINWALKEEGMVPYQPEMLQISECIEMSVALHQIHANNKNIELSYDIDQELMACADRNAMLTIMRNIIGNAIKFTGEDGTIKIMANNSGSHTDIMIRDSGVGISKKDLKTLFDFSDHHITKGTLGEKGSGLGLHLVNDLMKINNGKINVDSELGKGTTVILSFPSSCNA